ncbi:MAG: c-type cytochrome [Planctomycetales bacterium]|nr:c-type cytochrome [Planctomycetales bacterium]
MPRSTHTLFLVLLVNCLFAATTGAQEVPPLAPDQARQAIHVRAGYRVELLAAEPLVQDPVAIDWGIDGKLWVAEMADYPLGLDGQGKPGGRVRYLEDLDGDGVYDRSTLFLEGLSFPNGIMAWNAGVLITAAPAILYAEDQDGDGRADVTRELYTGFLDGNQQLRVNGLRWGLDNLIYCASGGHHANYGKDRHVTIVATGEQVALGSRDFRFDPDRHTLEPQSGPSQFGRNRDAWGNWFGVQNSHPLWHYVLDDHYLRRNPHVVAPDARHFVVTPTNPRVYPAKAPQKRFHSFDNAGRFTSACSGMIYRDAILFGDDPTNIQPSERSEFGQQHAFTCEPFHNLVQHNIVISSGESFAFRRAAEESQIDFFASSDRWCRPVMVRTGPDGALWVVDMYRYMIEHPDFLTPEGREELKPHFRAGEDRGRIYRVVRDDSPSPRMPRFPGEDPDAWVSLLEHTNGWIRDRAQQWFVRHQPADGHSALRRMFNESTQATARLHALSTLAGCDQHTVADLQRGLIDSHPAIRRRAVELAAEMASQNDGLATAVIALGEDPSPSVQRQVAYTLGEIPSAASGVALARMLDHANARGHRFLHAAALSSVTQDHLPVVLAETLAHTQLDEPTLATLIGLAQAYEQPNALRAAVSFIVDGVPREEPWRYRALGAVLDGIGLDPTRQMLSNSDQLDAWLLDARECLLDTQVSTTKRQSAASLYLRESELSIASLDQLRDLLAPSTDHELIPSLVIRLEARREPSIGTLLLELWSSSSPGLRGQFADVLLSRTIWAGQFLDAVEQRRLSLSELDNAVRQRLLTFPHQTTRDRASRLLDETTPAERQAVIDSYRSHEGVGNSEVGRELFAKHCSVCHRFAGIGTEVGPNLAALSDRSRDYLLTSILNPNRAIESKYMAYSAETKEGRIFSGIVATESAGSLTLITAEGKRVDLLRHDLASLQSTGRSLMPDGWEKLLPATQMSDLVAFLQVAEPVPGSRD